MDICLLEADGSVREEREVVDEKCRACARGSVERAMDDGFGYAADEECWPLFEPGPVSCDGLALLLSRRVAGSEV